ncbi:MAG TPA: NADH-quinone oxidoreductase subunit H [Chitinivibrionales bacterium]
MLILVILLQIILIPLLSPLGIGITRKIKAKLQNRQGAAVTQPYKDLWKLFHKDEVLSVDASWIFRLTPFFVFTVSIVAGASIPIFFSLPYTVIPGDMLVIIYTLGIGTFFTALAGMDTGSPFGGFGSSREITTSALAEGGLLFSLLTLALIGGSTDLFCIANAIGAAYTPLILPILLAFSGFFIVLLCETKRYPFDNPSTHLELTMIHEAMILEYSGKRLALMEWAAANKLLIFVSLGANLFFPWGIARSIDGAAIFFGLLFFILKAVLFYVSIAAIESGMAKFRFFRLPDLLMVAFILNVIAIGMVRFKP